MTKATWIIGERRRLEAVWAPLILWCQMTLLEPEIQWQKVWDGVAFCSMAAEDTRATIGLEKGCGGLMGALPLVRGMRVALTNHIDRSSKRLLKGRTGVLVGWELDDREGSVPVDCDHHLTHRPRCVYVQFFEDDECQIISPWQIGSLSPGVYPIKSRSETWELTPNSKSNSQKIRRTQFPIVPDYARTAYSMQGFTLPVGKVDLKMRNQTDAVTAYIALSRFRKAEHCLIMQPFDISVCQQGVARQPELMLMYLKDPGSDSFRIALEQCVEEMAGLKETQRLAAQAARDVQKVLQCTGECKQLKPKNQFSASAWKHRARSDAVCLQCSEEREQWQCGDCKEMKSMHEYEATRWKKRKSKPGGVVCEECWEKPAQWQCVECNEMKSRHEYEATRWKNRKKRGGTCLECATATMAMVRATVKAHGLDIKTSGRGASSTKIQKQVAEALANNKTKTSTNSMTRSGRKRSRE